MVNASVKEVSVAPNAINALRAFTSTPNALSAIVTWPAQSVNPATPTQANANATPTSLVTSATSALPTSSTTRTVKSVDAIQAEHRHCSQDART